MDHGWCSTASTGVTVTRDINGGTFGFQRSSHSDLVVENFVKTCSSEDELCQNSVESCATDVAYDGSKLTL